MYHRKKEVTGSYKYTKSLKNNSRQQGDCEVTDEVFVSAATIMNNNYTKWSSKIVSYQFFFVKHKHTHT